MLRKPRFFGTLDNIPSKIDAANAQLPHETLGSQTYFFYPLASLKTFHLPLDQLYDHERRKATQAAGAEQSARRGIPRRGYVRGYTARAQDRWRGWRGVSSPFGIREYADVGF